VRSSSKTLQVNRSQFSPTRTFSFTTINGYTQVYVANRLWRAKRPLVRSKAVVIRVSGARPGRYYGVFASNCGEYCYTKFARNVIGSSGERR
jgi:hypothetical protein